MKKQYIFLLMIGIILYISYLIITFSYKEYKINSHIEFITQLNHEIKEENKQANEIIEYKKSRAYKNKILKEQQSYKNKGEQVVYLTTEDIYNKFTKEYIPSEDTEGNKDIQSNESLINSMNIYQKWIYFLFKKDMR